MFRCDTHEEFFKDSTSPIHKGCQVRSLLESEYSDSDITYSLIKNYFKDLEKELRALTQSIQNLIAKFSDFKERSIVDLTSLRPKEFSPEEFIDKELKTRFEKMRNDIHTKCSIAQNLIKRSGDQIMSLSRSDETKTVKDSHANIEEALNLFEPKGNKNEDFFDDDLPSISSDFTFESEDNYLQSYFSSNLNSIKKFFSTMSQKNLGEFEEPVKKNLLQAKLFKKICEVLKIPKIVGVLTGSENVSSEDIESLLSDDQSLVKVIEGLQKVLPQEV